MRFIGLDLAWSARNGTGAAVIVGDERAGRLGRSALLGADDEVVAFVREHAGSETEPALVAIDAPLRVPNEDGRRRAGAEIDLMFARYHAGAHPANRRRLAVDGGVRGEALVDRLEALGFVYEPEVEARAPTRQVIEVYPHPAMVSIFGLDRILKYKSRASLTPEARLAAFERYHALLRSLSTADPALVGADDLLVQDLSGLRRAALKAHEDRLGAASLLARALSGLRRAALKAHEDRLDGVMCAYVAHYLWRWGMARARAFGSRDVGSITTPIPREHWPAQAVAGDISPRPV